jgi:hypothetical protein
MAAQAAMVEKTVIDPPKDPEAEKWIRGDTNGRKVVNEGLKNKECNR